jgi:hypothetical protein
MSPEVPTSSPGPGAGEKMNVPSVSLASEATATREQVRERSLQLMASLPSKAACVVRLRTEGFPPEIVEEVVTELFALRKRTATANMQRREDAQRTLIRLLDTGNADGTSLGDLHASAFEYAPKLRVDVERIRVVKVVLLLVIAVSILIIVVPHIALLVLLFSVKYPITVGTPVWGAMAGIAWHVIAIGRRYQRAKRRRDALLDCARKMHWDDVIAAASGTTDGQPRSAGVRTPD